MSTAKRSVAVWSKASVATTVTVTVPSSLSSLAATVSSASFTETVARRGSSTVAVYDKAPPVWDAAKCAERSMRVSSLARRSAVGTSTET